MAKHQPEAASWPLQLDGHLNGIKETFTRLNQELDLTRRERDDYKAQLDAQAKELDDFRKFFGRRDLPGVANTFENDEKTEFTATLAPDIPAQANPIIHEFESAGSPLDDSNNNATSEVSKCKGSLARNTGFNTGVKKLLDIKLVYTLPEGNVRHVRFSPDGKYLGTVCSDGVTNIYETETGNNVYVLFDWYLADKYTHAEKSIKGVDLQTICFSPDNRYLATAGMDRKIRIWEIGKKGIRNIFKGDALYPGSLDFLSNGRFIVSGSSDSRVRLWNMRTGIPTIFKGSRSQIFSVRSSPDGRYIAAGTTDMVLIWAIRSSTLVNCSLEHPGFINGVDFSQDGMRLVTGSSGGTLKLWDISFLMLADQQGLRGQGGTVGGVQCLRNFVNAGYVWTVNLSHDGRWVLSGEYDDQAYFWDTRNGKRQRVAQVPQNSAVFSPVGDYLAVGTSDKQVMVWTYRMI